MRCPEDFWPDDQAVFDQSLKMLHVKHLKFSCMFKILFLLKDWEELTEKYRASSHKEDRRLYKLIQGSFLPEIKDMFK